MDPMEAIRQTFFCECEEQLAELETGLLALEGGSYDRETVDAVFRAVHSITPSTNSNTSAMASLL